MAPVRALTIRFAVELDMVDVLMWSTWKTWVIIRHTYTSAMGDEELVIDGVVAVFIKHIDATLHGIAAKQRH